MKLVGLPSTKRGSSDCSGMKTMSLPPLVTRSRPWSKNCPKKVIQALNGADRPASGAMFGMKKVGVSSAVPNSPSRPGLVTIWAPSLSTSSAVPRTPSTPGSKAAATAAGLSAVMSTIRLLMMRGWASITVPVVCA
ncbi:hypothetical protein D3C84_868890 [compost metagenome]